MSGVINIVPEIWRGKGDMESAWRAGYGRAGFDHLRAMDDLKMANANYKHKCEDNEHEVEVWRDQLEQISIKSHLLKPLDAGRIDPDEGAVIRDLADEIINLVKECLKRKPRNNIIKEG